MQNDNNKRIDYVEFSAEDISKIKKFYSEVFGWNFTDYGSDYTSFNDGNLSGGFSKASKVIQGGALVIIYSVQLEKILEDVKKSGGKIVKEIFEFPGGRRFHFLDPSGNELAVWSDK